MKDVVSEDFKSNSKKFWAYVKNKGQEYTGVAPLKSKEWYLKKDAQSKTETLNDQFHSVFTKEDIDDFPNMGPSPHQAMGKITIDQHGVHKLLSNLQPHKATGPDQIPPGRHMTLHRRWGDVVFTSCTRWASFVLKAVADDLAPFLQASLDQGIVPRLERCQCCSYLQERGKTYSGQLPSSIPDFDNMQDLGTHRAQQYHDPLRQVQSYVITSTVSARNARAKHNW